MQCKLAGKPHVLFRHCRSWDSAGFLGRNCRAKVWNGDTIVSNQTPLLRIWYIVPSCGSYKSLETGISTSSTVLGVSFDKKANISWRLNLEHLALSHQLLLKMGYPNNKFCFVRWIGLTFFFFFEFVFLSLLNTILFFNLRYQLRTCHSRGAIDPWRGLTSLSKTRTVT